MTTPFLTIGMAHHTDYHGVYFSIQALKLYHDISDVELIVVDNSPTNKHGEHVRTLVKGWSQKFHSVKYVPFDGPNNGTTQTRQRIFDEATGEAVVCMDCHVMFERDGVKNIKKYWRDNPNSRNIISGPIILDDTMRISTHFHPRWRSEMFGIWAHGFHCPKCEHTFVVDVDDSKSQEQIQVGNVYDMMTANGPLSNCPTCNHTLPQNFQFSGHQSLIKNEGFYYMFSDERAPKEVEIPAQGLGFFSMLKEHWPRFNPYMKGFGGEEGYIHEKVRQNGGKALSIQGLGWNHRFGRPDGVKYPLLRSDKVRNYVLAWNEIGWPLNSIYDHFVKTGKITQREWNAIIANPENYTPGETPFTKAGLALPKKVETLPELADWTRTQPRDLNQHVLNLITYSNKCEHITEITNRRESTVALACGVPKKIISYTTEADELITSVLSKLCQENTPSVELETKVNQEPNGSIEPTDLLFVDNKQNGPYIRNVLNTYAKEVKKYILIHDTELYGRRGHGNEEGMWPALKEFTESTDWFVTFHDRNQFGLTVLSNCEGDERIEPKKLPWPPGWGVGTELKKLLGKIGITSTKNCKCNARAEIMDRNGISWCELNKHKILEWLEEESRNRNLPFVKSAASLVLNLAIKKAKKVKAKDHAT